MSDDSRNHAPRRARREIDERQVSHHDDEWVNPSVLPEPTPMPGYRYHWIRGSSMGSSDIGNMSFRTREGWVPVTVEEQPQLAMLARKVDSSVTGGVHTGTIIEIGGLILMKMPEERASARDRAMIRQAGEQLRGVDENWMRENDPRMPVLKPERKTSESYGRK